LAVIVAALVMLRIPHAQTGHDYEMEHNAVMDYYGSVTAKSNQKWRRMMQISAILAATFRLSCWTDGCIMCL